MFLIFSAIGRVETIENDGAVILYSWTMPEDEKYGDLQVT